MEVTDFCKLDSASYYFSLHKCSITADIFLKIGEGLRNMVLRICQEQWISGEQWQTMTHKGRCTLARKVDLHLEKENG
jgi:hypothetical protein